MFRQWRAFNILYNQYRKKIERDRLIMAVQQGVTEDQATAILALVNREVEKLTELPPGNLWLDPSDPEFRRRTTDDMAIVNDVAQTSCDRLAHLMSTVYQVQ